MPKCKGCGKEKLLLLQGLCSNCRKAEKSTKIGVSQIVKQVEQLSKEREKVVNSKDLTPDNFKGFTRSYHYKDVNVTIYWQYGGQYGKDCKSIGMKRGQHIELLLKPQEDDKGKVAICWNGIEVAMMKSNRLRNMVHQWLANDLPVQCVVAAVGGEQKLLLEFAFYGKPNSKTEKFE